MWKNALQLLEELRSLDKQCQAFGSDVHGYRLQKCVSDHDCDQVEARLGAQLPEQLRAFYRTSGNGLAGPYYGMHSIQNLMGLRPDEPYSNTNGLETSPDHSDDNTESTERFSNLTGLIGIIDFGCGDEVCIVTNGDQLGQIVMTNEAEGNTVQLADNLLDFYTNWLQMEIGIFKTTKALIENGSSLETISNVVRDKYQRHNAGDLVSSVLDTKKPTGLFGNIGAKRYHGATQQPWYEKLLESYRRRK